MDRSQAADIIRASSQVVFFLALPVVIAFAWLGWAKLRGMLTPWRYTLGAISLAIVSITWLSVIVLLVFIQINHPWARFVQGEGFLSGLFWADIVAIALASTLIGKPRLLGILAGFLMVGFWFSSYVE